MVLIPGKMNLLETKSFLQLESGTFIFAMINGIIITGATALITGTMMYLIGSLIYQLIYQPRIDAESMFFFGIAIFLLVATYIAFVFAVNLVMGALRRDVTQLRTYFHYGVVTNTLSVAGSISWLVITNGCAYVNCLICLSVCFVYALVLAMIYNTYKKLELGVTSQFDQKRLIDC